MGEKFKIYCPICGKMQCVIEENSTVEIACTRKCGIFRITVKNGDLTIKKVNNSNEKHSSLQPIKC